MAKKPAFLTKAADAKQDAAMMKKEDKKLTKMVGKGKPKPGKKG